MIHCLGSHIQMMKWIWETNMTEKSKQLVTGHSEHKHRNILSQIEYPSHIKSEFPSEKCKCDIKGISDTESLQMHGARVQ